MNRSCPSSSTRRTSAFVQPISLRPSPFQTLSSAKCGLNVHYTKPRYLCNLQQPKHEKDKQVDQKEVIISNDNNQKNRFQFPKIIRRVGISKALIATIGTILGTTCYTPRPFYPSNHNHNHYPYSVSLVQKTHAAQSNSSSSSVSTEDQQQSNKNVRYNGRKELDSSEKAMSLMLTGGAFAALGVWAWKQNRKDDELESIRIKEEVERLEKLRAEFMDVEEDDDSLDDEDLLASLKQRLSEEENDDDKDDTEGDKEDNDSNIKQQQSNPNNVDNSNSENSDDNKNISTDNVDTPNDSKQDLQKSNPDSVDMLRRMWDATDDDPKKGTDKQ